MSVSFLSLPKELKTYILSLYLLAHEIPYRARCRCLYSNLNFMIDWACDDKSRLGIYNTFWVVI